MPQKKNAIDWKRTWQHNGTAVMISGFIIRPVLMFPLLVAYSLGELAMAAYNRIEGFVPGIDAIYRDQ